MPVTLRTRLAGLLALCLTAMFVSWAAAQSDLSVTSEAATPEAVATETVAAELVATPGAPIDATAAAPEAAPSPELIDLTTGAPVDPASVDGQIAPKWSVALPATSCSWSASDRNCHQSSPGVGDINRDGRLDVVVATNNGHVVVVANGAVLWDRDVAPLMGMGANRQSFASSPAVADLDGNGTPEIVVATSAISPDCKPGSVIVLTHQGQLQPGWPRPSDDEKVPPANCPDPFFSTPALGDIDGNGDLEIVIGGFDARIYAYHHNGALVHGFPPPSALYYRFGWENLRTRLGDTIWSSPALADMNGDGRRDILLGTDEGNWDSSYPGDSGGWTCPYRLPAGWAEGNCGGALYGLTGGGQLLPGFPQYRLEVFQSTPALSDVNGDGRPEIFIGTGTFYHNNSPDHPTQGMRMWGFDSQGRELPGWAGGLATSGLLPASPAIGDIAGDAAPEIVITTLDGAIFAWHVNGARVAGFPMTPTSPFGDKDSQNVGKGVSLADYDGDGKMEIFMTIGWTVGIIDGNGQMITKTKTNDASRPSYFADGLLLNNPALADVDGDGQLELIAHNSRLYIWDMPSGAVRADWPMFKHDPARTGAMAVAAAPPSLTVTPKQLTLIQSQTNERQVDVMVRLSVPGTTFNWQLSANSGNISFPQPSGTATGTTLVPARVRLPGNLGGGNHALGTVTVNVSGQGIEIRNSHATVGIGVRVIKNGSTVFMSAVRR